VLLSGNDPAKVQREVERVLSAYPTVKVQTRAQFEKSSIPSVNQLLTLAYALLALEVLAALMLSVFERTREIGLLRAVGMKGAKSARWSALSRSSCLCSARSSVSWSGPAWV
jgi:putative ABC transport system permease protein